MSKWKPLRGIITPIATPLTKSGNTIDKDGTFRLLEHVINGGVSGVFILGSTGEGPSLPPSLRREFVSICCDYVRDNFSKIDGNGESGSGVVSSRGIRILVGVTDPCPAESIALARHASACGADAAVVAPPFYFPLTQQELAEHVGRIAEESDPLPIVLYNMPALTKVKFEIDTVRKLAQRYGTRRRDDGGGGGWIVGMKDSSFDLGYAEEICRVKKEICPNWMYLTGADHHVASVVRMGGDGGVVCGSNLFPEAFVSFYEGAVEENVEKERRALEKIEALKAIYADGRFVQATKTALSFLGICEDNFAPPLLPLEDAEREKIEEIMLTVHKMKL